MLPTQRNLYLSEVLVSLFQLPHIVISATVGNCSKLLKNVNKGQSWGDADGVGLGPALHLLYCDTWILLTV